jgi:hypothetical protein
MQGNRQNTVVPSQATVQKTLIYTSVVSGYTSKGRRYVWAEIGEGP